MSFLTAASAASAWTDVPVNEQPLIPAERTARSENKRIGIIRVLGLPVLARSALWVLDYVGVTYLMSGGLPFVRTLAPTLPAWAVLGISVNPLVLRTEALTLSVWVFFAIAWPRALLGDYANYLIGQRSVQYVRIAKTPRALHALCRKFAAWRCTARLCNTTGRMARRLRSRVNAGVVWLQSLRGWSVLLAVFLLKLSPWTPISATTLGGAAQARPRAVMLVSALATPLKLAYLYITFRCCR